MTYGVQNSNYGFSTDAFFSSNSSTFDIKSLGNTNNFLEAGDILDTPFTPPSATKPSEKSSQSLTDQILAYVSNLWQQMLAGKGGWKSAFSSGSGDIQDPPPAYNEDTSPPPYEAPPSYAHATDPNQVGGEDNPPVVSKTNTNPATATNPAEGTHSIGDINVDGGGKNTITVKNTSDKEQSYALFTNPGPGATSSFGVPNGFVTLKPGESANFKLPDQSSGYVQQMNNYSEADYKAGKAPTSDNFKATRAEYTFNADGSLYFNDSNIDGYNSALKMTSNGQVAGSSESILEKVKKTNPGLISVVGGQEVIEGSQFFSDQTNDEARRTLDKYINHNDNPDNLDGNTTTYVMPDDNKAVRGTKSNSLVLEFGNA